MSEATEVHALREQLAVAHETIRQLNEAIVTLSTPPSAMVKLAARLRLTRSEQIILATLLTVNGFVSRERLLHILAQRPWTADREVQSLKSIDVLICRLRKSLRRYDDSITIETLYGEGWRMTPRGKATLGALAGDQ